MDYVINSDGELYHWGTKGMRWGIRKYQNKDGSLTPAGKKRYAKEEAKLKEREKTIKNREREAARKAKLDAKKADLDARENALKKGTNNKAKTENKQANRPKTIREMSDDELRDHINRMRLEKEVYDTRKALLAANPPQVSTSKKFMNSLVNDVLAPTAVKVGKDWMEKTLRKKFGLESTQALENRWKKLDYKKKIAQLEKDIREMGDGDELADLKREYDIADYKKKIEKLNTSRSDEPDIEELLAKYGDMTEEQRNRYKNAAAVKGWEENLTGKKKKDKD